MSIFSGQDIKVRQIHSAGQEDVLRHFAHAAAKDQCRFLEVGSWCGDSAIILGQVAKEHNGILFCVDWWKGNMGTELSNIAEAIDIFSFFWNRVCAAGLEDVVIPIRSRSDLLENVLQDNTFDLVFLDADHRYTGIKKDLDIYSKTVKYDGGIFCGHDCPGYLADYDQTFLEAGKDVDMYESVHCGVVLAVNEKFTDYSVNHDFWSVKANGKETWLPFGPLPQEDLNKKQTGIAPIAVSQNYAFFRLGRKIYRVPKEIYGVDLTEADNELLQTLMSFDDLGSAQQYTKEALLAPPHPTDIYKEYAIYTFNNQFYGLPERADTDFCGWFFEDKLKQYTLSNALCIASSLEKLKQIIDTIETSKNEPAISFNFPSVGVVDFLQADIEIKSVNTNVTFKAEPQKIKALTKGMYTLSISLAEKNRTIQNFKNEMHLMRLAHQEQTQQNQNVLETLNKELQAKEQRILSLEASLRDMEKVKETQGATSQENHKIIDHLTQELRAKEQRILTLEADLELVNKATLS